MDSGRVVSRDRTYVPNRYRVALEPADLEAFAAYRATLEADLADALRARARQRGYRLVARPMVSLIGSDTVEQGDIRVTADALDPAVVRAVSTRDANGGEELLPATHAGLRPVAMGPGTNGQARTPPNGNGYAAVPLSPGPGTGNGPASLAGSPFTSTSPERLAAGIGTMPSALVHVRMQGGVVRTFTFGGGSAHIGRSNDNEIIIIDDRVSRRHGRLTNRQGTLVYTDLGSTNGSFVNGTRVREIALGGGDVVRLGNSTLTIQPRP